MKLITIFLLSFFSFFLPLHIQSEEQVSSISYNFLMKDYKDVAIATDLEPDDVLALGIIFQDANAIYAQQTEKNYPIKLIVVGQANSENKKIRMETLLYDYFNLPEGIEIPVVAGKSTNSDFPYEDGENQAIPSDKGSAGVKALADFIAISESPFIIQLKPAQELFEVSLDSSVSQKAIVLFYGGFNLRETVLDSDMIKNSFFDSVRNDTFPAKLQKLMDHFSTAFEAVGIIETYGILGNEPAVYREYAWTKGISDSIENSHNPFLEKFIEYTYEWNQYLLLEELTEIGTNLENALIILASNRESINGFSNAVIFSGLLDYIKKISYLKGNWNDALFQEVYDNMLYLDSLFYKENPTQLAQTVESIASSLKFANQLKPTSGLQFTLSDVAVAMAINDEAGFFGMTPVSIQVNAKGHLETTRDDSSRVFYFNRIDRVEFATTLESILVKYFAE